MPFAAIVPFQSSRRFSKQPPLSLKSEESERTRGLLFLYTYNFIIRQVLPAKCPEKCRHGTADLINFYLEKIGKFCYLYKVLKIKWIMTQLIVSLEDASVLADIKKAIGMLRGVASVKESTISDDINATTLKAIEEVERGDTFVCEDFEEYLKLVGRELPD